MSLADYPYRVLAKWISEDPEAFIALGNIETRLLKKRLQPIVGPLYVCGLARAGTTILTECLALHPLVATHIYRDFPCLFTPYLWKLISSPFRLIPHKARPRERAHKDGIMVTPDSPESMEEMLWMAFFRTLHDEGHSCLLDAKAQNKAFADFYREHLQKLLLVRKKSRYAAKANYTVTRIPYILSIFPDARFVIAVRHPVPHIWSLYQKHRLFLSEQERNPATLIHMDRSGHFEFGKHRALIHVGDEQAMASLKAAFAAGDDLRGWARYWAMMHNYIATTSERHPEILIVRHEDIVDNPHGKMREIYEHCRLNADEALLDATAAKLRKTSLPAIPEEARDIILEETRSAASSFYEL